ncbi:prolyl-4-hydroxylase-alpha MP [Haematobia irritans]|uniref:prolyl-4-hydroxylase-alpha MP n=1 Tax=Haematobia irritans TaxID=7368 RepID=UPI003F501C38
MSKNFTKLIVVHVILAITLMNIGYGQAKEFFTSIAGLEDLLTTEMQLRAEMQNYIDALTQHIQLLQSEMDIVHHEHWKASKDLEGYLSNPINAYRLIKRLHTDWPTFEESVVSDTSRSDFLHNIEDFKKNLSFPTEDDMVGSTKALVRLQDTYNLDVAQVASGILNGMKYGSPMTWQDCFLVGEYLYAMYDFNHTIPWFKQTTKLLQNDIRLAEDQTVLDFLETLIDYYRSMGDYESAGELCDYIISRDPERKGLIAKKSDIQKEKDNMAKETKDNKTEKTNSESEATEYQLYRSVCRGDHEHIISEQQKLLFCKLHTNNNPYLFLQPQKLEELSLDPYIIYVHEVLTDKQMMVVKEIAKPRMNRSQVFRDTEDEIHENSDFRISKTAWLDYDEHEHLQSMRLFVGYISGLNIDVVEQMQLVNYGLGGHYGPHFDFFLEPTWYSPEIGNRIATAMFYLSDVQDGGGTAFTFLNTLVRPRKGSLLLWYNLHSSGEPDYRVNHGACPVLKGSKWIANIWIRERAQIQSKPCDLTDNHDKSLIYKKYAYRD